MDKSIYEPLMKTHGCVAVGRGNWIFCGSPAGGRRAAKRMREQYPDLFSPVEE